MAYQTGPSTGLTDLFNKLSVFASANGWTVTRHTANEFCLNNGVTYENIYFDEGAGTIYLRLAQDWDNALDWNAQPGFAPLEQYTYGVTGSLSTYHFFTNASGDYLHIVIEVNSGYFRHICFGRMAKTSTQLGGDYSGTVWQNTGTTATYTTPFTMRESSTYGREFRAPCFLTETPEVGQGPLGKGVWADCNRYANYRGDVAGLFTDFHGNHNYAGFYYDWHKYGTPTTFNQQSVLTPIHAFVARADGMWSPVGTVMDIRNVSMETLNPSSTLTIGANNWIVFPVVRKATGNDASGTLYGYAYKIIP